MSVFQWLYFLFSPSLTPSSIAPTHPTKQNWSCFYLCRIPWKRMIEEPHKEARIKVRGFGSYLKFGCCTIIWIHRPWCKPALWDLLLMEVCLPKGHFQLLIVLPNGWAKGKTSSADKHLNLVAMSTAPCTHC